MKLRHTGSDTKGGGVGPMVTENLSCTIAAAVQDQTLITGGGTAYGINPVMSGVMMETKPAEETAQTLRKSPGGENGVMCLNPQDQQTGRVYNPNGAMTSLQAGGGVSGMRRESVLMTDLSQMRYIVRRLTPTECERLMGLPDSYTIPTGLRRFFDANGEPAPELVAEFQRIFDTFGAIMADYAHTKPPKPKSAKQVADWLKKIANPATCPDSPRYKGCGNGWATNQPRWILTRLLNAEDIEW